MDYQLSHNTNIVIYLIATSISYNITRYPINTNLYEYIHVFGNPYNSYHGL